MDLRHYFGTVFVAICIALAGLLVVPHQTQAQGSCVPLPPLPFAVPTDGQKQGTQTAKECILDIVVPIVKQQLIDSITQSIINWINSGFEGGPAFVQDLDSFLLGVADRAAGDFIQGSELGFLCSPFSANIRISLALNYYQPEDKFQCTLTDVVDNTEQFVQGTFSEGGWRGWLDVSTQPHNNPYGSYLEAQSELAARVNTAQSREGLELNFGGGFKSDETCINYTTTDGETEERCVNTTPGTVIQEQLNQALPSGMRSLEVADEINEIVSAALAQLAQMALQEGLAAIGSASDGSGRTYFDEIDDDIRQQAEDTADSGGDNVSALYEGPRELERAYIDEREETLSAAEQAVQAVQEVQACYRNHLENSTVSVGRSATGLTPSQADVAEQRIASASSTLTSEVLPVKNAIQSDIEEAEDNIAAVNEVENEMEEELGTSSPDQIGQTLQDYTQLEERLPEDIDLHDRQDLNSAQQENQTGEFVGNTTVKQMQSIEGEYDQKLQTCQQFPNTTTTGGGGGGDGGAPGGPGGGAGGGGAGAGAGGGGDGGSGGGGCFLAGTEVRMADGSTKPIQAVDVGDVVLGKGGTHNTVTALKPTTLGERRLYSINDGQAFVTGGHRFWTQNGWQAINPSRTDEPVSGVLRTGDTIVSESGTVTVETIDARTLPADTPLYNISTDGNHTYVANGYVVHNVK